MSFTEDATEFIDTDGFADTATYNTTTINGIFGNEYVEVLGSESTRPVFTCATSDVSSAAHGDSLVVNGTTYEVVGVQQDLVGLLTTLILSE